jgi:hypothetical protein
MKSVLLLMLALPLQQVAPPLIQAPADPNVRGTIQGIVKSTTGEGIPDVQVTLSGRAAGPGGAGPQVNRTTDASGRFSFTDAAGGSYTVAAQRERFFPDHDVTGLRADIHGYPDISARITMKGEPPTGARPQIPFRVQLRPQEPLGGLVAAASTLSQQPNPDGTIVFSNLFPGKYKIAGLGLTPPGYYLADIRHRFQGHRRRNRSDQSRAVALTASAHPAALNFSKAKRPARLSFFLRRCL